MIGRVEGSRARCEAFATSRKASTSNAVMSSSIKKGYAIAADEEQPLQSLSISGDLTNPPFAILLPRFILHTPVG